MNDKTIIVVEDNETMRMAITDSLTRAGYDVVPFASGPPALQHLNGHTIPLMITDLRMEPIDGIALLEQARQRQPQLEVLLISAFGTVEDAVKAMQLGAADFMTKPFSNEELRIRVHNIFKSIEKERKLDTLEAQNSYLLEELQQGFQTIIGQSPAMTRVYELIDRVAGENSAVLIEGESGTGKELVARAVHAKSPRKDKPFVRVNCGALNDNLLESELFGHEKGAFTGALRTKRGRFELADGGTLFLDEIGDVSAAMQVKLLRALQEKEFERVGGEKTISVDVRIIAATNRDLNHMMLDKTFREDLYYRLSVFPLKLPPLRDRGPDISLLANHFIQTLNRRRSVVRRIGSSALDLLQNYSWPGNIRELENLIERLHVISVEEEISPQLVAHFLTSAPTGSSVDYEQMPLDKALYAFEQRLIVHAMQKADGVKNRAARLLGIGTSALYYKLEKFGLL